MKSATAKSPAALAIRPATEADAALIQSLAQSIWPVCFAGVIPPEKIANMLEGIYSIENLHRQMHEGQRFWVAYHEARAAGYVSAYKEGDAIWIKKLYCEPALQGRGIGTAMMAIALAAFAPASEVRLLVNRDNAAAIAYYERAGFRRTAEVPVMMGDSPFVDYLYCKAL